MQGQASVLIFFPIQQCCRDDIGRPNIGNAMLIPPSPGCCGIPSPQPPPYSCCARPARSPEPPMYMIKYYKLEGIRIHDLSLGSRRLPRERSCCLLGKALAFGGRRVPALAISPQPPILPQLIPHSVIPFPNSFVPIVSE